MKTIKDIIEEDSLFRIGVILVLFFPIFTFFPSTFLNLHVITCCFYFLYLKIKKKISFSDFSLFLEYKLLLILFLLLIVNLFINQTFSNSITRTIGFGRFLIFIPMIIFFIRYKNFKYIDLYLKFWTIFFIFISFDLLFEFIIGHNLIGNISNYAGRLSGLMGEELVIGYFYFLFFLTISAFILKKFKSNYLSILIVTFFFIINFFIGERSNFTKSIFAVIIILPLILNYKNLKKIILLFSFLVLITFIILKTSSSFKGRYIDSFLKPLIKNPKEFYRQVPHGSHYNTAIKMFYERPLFGIGLKNFRYKCQENKYEDTNFSSNNERCSTHPHQHHFEILSELGIFIYLFFLIFIGLYIKNQILAWGKNKNILFLSTFSTVASCLVLPVPTGSFFSSYSSTLFWFLFSLSVALRKLKN